MATYDYMTSLKNDGRKVQVESAKRDGDGKNIANNYAKQNGYYQDLTAGLAENLAPYSEQSGASDTTPFVFQSSGGSSDIGSLAYLKALRGNSIAWNSLFNLDNFTNETINGITFTKNNDGSITISGTATADVNKNIVSGTWSLNHKYLIKGLYNNGVNNKVYWLDTYYGQFTSYQDFFYTPTNSSYVQRRIAIHISNGETVNFKLKPLIVDITSLGKDYSTILAFNRDYPKTYYPYNEGELLSCKVNGYKTVGYNAFDGELENGYINTTTGNSDTDSTFKHSGYIKVIAGQTYTCEMDRTSQTWTYVYEYDANKNFIKETDVNKGNTITLDSKTAFVRLGWQQNTVNSNYCFHLTWDGARTGYKSHETHAYPMPNVELKSAGSAYDELKPDGTLIRRIGVVDLGTLNWNIAFSTNGFWLFDITTAKLGNVDMNYLISSSRYKKVFPAGSSMSDLTCGFSSGTHRFFLKDLAYTTLEQIKTALNGVMLYYELAEPTEEVVTGYQEITPIDDWGTQEFLYDSDIDIPVPQGNEFFYPVDYKAFIDSVGGRDDIEYDAGQLVSLTQLNNFLKTIAGYDATKNQSLKNVSGTIQWVTEE